MQKRRHVLERPAVNAKVKALILEGVTNSEIARQLSTKSYTVSPQAVSAFRKRHATEVTALTVQVEKQIEDYAIAKKVNRIAALNQLYEDVEAWQQSEGVNRDIVSAKRGILRDVAEETGQLSKDGDKPSAVATAVVIVRNNSPELGV